MLGWWLDGNAIPSSQEECVSELPEFDKVVSVISWALMGLRPESKH